MRVATYEGVVTDGLIRVPASVRLPNNTKVYVIVPDAEAEPMPPRVASPRLASPADAADFVMEVDEASDDEV